MKKRRLTFVRIFHKIKNMMHSKKTGTIEGNDQHNGYTE
jgi:hypothetical protein